MTRYCRGRRVLCVGVDKITFEDSALWLDLPKSRALNV